MDDRHRSRPIDTMPPVSGPTAEIVAALRATAVLATAGDATLERLADASQRRVLERGAVLFIEGERPAAVYAVASGMLRVFVTAADGSEPTLGVLTGGAHVGEMGVLEGRRHSASVAALRRSDVIVIPAAAFKAAYEDDGAIARQLVTLLADRVRAVSEGLADLTSLDLGGRLAKYLLNEAELAGTDRFPLRLSQSELGQLVGGARQTVNQLMRSLERDGLIALEGRNVRVVDPDGLRLRASSAL